MLLSVENLHVYYGAIHAVMDASLHVQEGEIVTLIGANGAGKSTFLKTVNRRNDLVEKLKIDGKELLDGTDI